MVRNPVQEYLQDIVDACRADHSGTVAGYIPELARCDPDTFGLCVATVDGYVYEVGDSRSSFAIQSISKPFTYALALADRGAEAVGAKIDVEPSGEPFNEISLSRTTERPSNPMINSGAITAASLVAGSGSAERFERVRASYARYAGRDLPLDDAIFASERAIGHRNRAIGQLLREFNVLEEDPDGVVDQYLGQCSLLADCKDLSLMAATLANGGLQPRTGERVLSPPLVEHVLSVMTTCGMYDAAGDWVSTVGMPAKSGVGGGIIAVLPGQVGIAVFSPRLDVHGNSVRGVETCRRLSRGLELHFLHVGRGARSAVRASYGVLASPSRRRRPDSEREVLDRFGNRAHVYELHGDLLFAGAESVVRAISEQDNDVELVVLDVRRVDEVTAAARTMLADLLELLRGNGQESVLVDPEGSLGVPVDGPGPARRVFDTRNAAVGWCEDRLIERHGARASWPERIDLADHPLAIEIGAEPMQVIEPMLVRRSFRDGETILPAGSPFTGIHIILSGRVATSVPWWRGAHLPLTILSAGMSFGEMALATGDGRASDVTADGPVEVLVLPADAVTRLRTEHPDVAIALWRAMARDAYRIMDRALREVATRDELGS